MIPLDAASVAGITRGELIVGPEAATVTGVTIDSRSLEPGDCFVAIIGARDDGHRYLTQALTGKASLVVVERHPPAELMENYPHAAVVLVSDTTVALQALARHVRNTIDPCVVGITGSIGKTTTKALAFDLVRHRWPTHASLGNFNNQWGLPLSLLGLEPGHDVMIAELGMSTAGEIRALARLSRPSIGVITNIAPVHMAFFDGLEGIAAAKQELAEELPRDGTLIVNADDARTEAIAHQLDGQVARVLTFGHESPADVGAVDPHRSGAGWSFDLSFPGELHIGVELPLPGPHSLANFLAAAAVGYVLGMSAAEVASGAVALSLPTMRGQLHRTPEGVTIFDDSYNASPTAMMCAIDTLVSLPAKGRRVLALGGMLELGSWAEDAHREVGLHAAHLDIDLIVTVGGLARDIGHGARAGGFQTKAIRALDTPDEAVDELLGFLRPGDLILVKGSRGIHMEEVTRGLLGEATEAEA